ncbi:DUF6660 family protein [Pedobacter helvus]|uniref:DUF6660 family protein n=1 Tax=Pedobacter helvus TaxID=2563444 RepID=A0ABW9JM28_9SPHI
MKWFVWLFSFYVLFLSCIPCTAEDDCCIDEISTTQSSKNESQNEQHKPSCRCSPFFACSTCHGVIPNSVDLLFSKLTLPVSKLQFFYSERDLLDFPLAIWQPPRLS